jgi:hypothetical protein
MIAVATELRCQEPDALGVGIRTGGHACGERRRREVPALGRLGTLRCPFLGGMSVFA